MAPKRVTRPVMRARAPSSISKSPATSTTIPAARKWPVTMSTAAPTVIKNPSQVKAFGVSGVLARSLASGGVTEFAKVLRVFSSFDMVQCFLKSRTNPVG